MNRRDFLRTTAALAGLWATRPLRSLAAPLAPRLSSGAARTSRLASSSGLFLVETDLHNHTLISGDALGDPGDALRQMRAAGIDVACLTEHAISGRGHGELTCPGHQQGGCHTVEGINETDWQTMRYIADVAYEPGAFVSFRGFEYSTPTVGHLNVWFSREFTDGLQQRAFVTPRAISEVDRLIPPTQPIVDLFEHAPDIATIRPFYDWLASAPGSAPFGGGNDGLACFNHPNDFGDFEAWTYHAGAAQRVTLFEALNTNGYNGDFFWYGADRNMPNPFNACLNAGWRVGFTGVSDEHSTLFGRPGMARGGLWVAATTRSAVQTAIAARRSFATLETGLRLDATANGAPMGSTLVHSAGPVTIALDVDRGPAWAGQKQLWAQVVRPGAGGPTLALEHSFTVPAPGDPAVTIVVPVDRADGDWLFVRLVDPDRPKHPNAPSLDPFEARGGVLAYASPWFLT